MIQALYRYMFTLLDKHFFTWLFGYLDLFGLVDSGQTLKNFVFLLYPSLYNTNMQQFRCYVLCIFGDSLIGVLTMQRVFGLFMLVSCPDSPNMTQHAIVNVLHTQLYKNLDRSPQCLIEREVCIYMDVPRQELGTVRCGTYSGMTMYSPLSVSQREKTKGMGCM